MRKAAEKNNVNQQMRVRYYIMNLIYRNSGKSIKIPSSRELAVRFGIARSTVQLALEKLIREKYLISRQGAATVTNPLRSLTLPPNSKNQLIGIKIYEGDAFYYGKNLCDTLSAIASELVERKFNIRLLMDAATTPESIAREVDESYLDGLVLYNTNVAYYQAARKKIPCVLIRNISTRDVSSGIGLSKKRAISQIAEMLKKEKRTRITEVVLQHKTKDEFNICHTLKKLDPALKTEQVLLSELPELFQKKPPEALIFLEQFADAIQTLVDESGLDILLFSRKEPPRDMNYKGYYLSFPIKKIACAAVDMLETCLAGENEPPPIIIEAELSHKHTSQTKEENKK